MTLASPASRVRVLHVLEAIFGGTARHLTDIVSVVRDVDHVVVVPSQRFGSRTDENALDVLAAAGAEVHVVDMRRTPTHPDNLAAYLRLVRIIRKARPDVVHGHSSIGGALGRAAALASPGTAKVWTPNGLLLSRPVIAIEKLLARVTDTTIAVSDSEADLMRNHRFDRAGEILVIPNGIDLDQVVEPLPLRAELGIPAGAPIVGTVARLVPQKAPVDFVACCQQIHAARPDAHFIIVGDGPLKASMEAHLAQWEHRDHFHHVPYLPDAALAMGAFDVFMLLSRYEGAPYAPLEAMRAGVPVVLSDVVGNRDTVEDGITGHLVPPGDIDSAATAAVGLLNSPADRAAMTKAAYKALYSTFDRELMGASLSRLYHRLAGSEADPSALQDDAAALEAELRGLDLAVPAGRVAAEDAPTLADLSGPIDELPAEAAV